MADQVNDGHTRWHRWRGTIGFIVLTIGTVFAVGRAQEANRVAAAQAEAENQARFAAECRQSADTRHVLRQLLDLSTQSTLPLSENATPEQRALRDQNTARVGQFMVSANAILKDPEC